MSPVVERLHRLLAERGRPWPAAIEHHPVRGSTNDRARELAASGAPPWTAVLADRQTGGRGRHGRTWLSVDGNLLLSLVLRPACEARRLGMLPIQVGVAVASALDAFGVHAQLKWPNDVELAGRKLGGILVEASSAARGACEWAIAGIGLNVALDPTEFPLLAETATSLRAATGIAPDVVEVAAAVLSALLDRGEAFAESPSALRAEWMARAGGFVGSEVRAEGAGPAVTGTVRDLDESGALVLETAA